MVLSVFRWLPKSTLARCARGNSRYCSVSASGNALYCTCIKTSCAVCKRWDRLTGDDTLWKRLDLGLAAVPAGALSKSFNLHIALHQGVLGTVLSRGCSILRLARATVAQPIFVSPTSNQVKVNSNLEESDTFPGDFSIGPGRNGLIQIVPP